MKKLLLATTIFAILGTSAFTAPKQQMPKEFIGSWCQGQNSEDGKETERMERDGCHTDRRTASTMAIAAVAAKQIAKKSAS